jgi:hypothetical protein
MPRPTRPQTCPSTSRFPRRNPEGREATATPTGHCPTLGPKVGPTLGPKVDFAGPPYILSPAGHPMAKCSSDPLAWNIGGEGKGIPSPNSTVRRHT